jgi:hypothetical protein
MSTETPEPGFGNLQFIAVRIAEIGSFIVHACFDSALGCHHHCLDGHLQTAETLTRWWSAVGNKKDRFPDLSNRGYR